MQGDDGAVTERTLDRRTYLAATGLTALGTGGTDTTAASVPGTLLVAADGPTVYEFEVSGDVIPVPSEGVRDAVESGTVSGFLPEGTAAYHVTGAVTDVRVIGDGRIDYGDRAREALSNPARVLVLTAPADVDCEVTVTGSAVPLDSESSATVDETDDGNRTVTCRGHTALAFQGTVADFTAEASVTVELDGKPLPRWRVGDSEPPHCRELVVTAPEAVSYEFATTGGIERGAGGDGAGETADESAVSRTENWTWKASGTVADGRCDTFSIYGTVTAFKPERGDFSLLVDGEPVAPGTLVGTGLETTVPTPVGGGEGYDGTVPRLSATATVETAAELTRALANATPGDVVFVAPTADIDIGTTRLTVPEGVTLASDRGVDAAPGGVVRTTEASGAAVTAEDDARVTGLCLAGPLDTFVGADSDRAGVGIDAVGSGVEIDNCEVSGFPSAAVRCGADTHVHHSYLHHIPMAPDGAAVRCTGGHPRVQHNYVNYARHGVTASGAGGCTVAYNRFGSEVLGHALDCDAPGGTTLDIHHNTVRAADSETTTAIAIRGEPAEGATVANNWFESLTGGQEAIFVQPGDSGRRNIEFADNRYGPEEPAGAVGHPRR